MQQVCAFVERSPVITTSLMLSALLATEASATREITVKSFLGRPHERQDQVIAQCRDGPPDALRCRVTHPVPPVIRQRTRAWTGQRRSFDSMD